MSTPVSDWDASIHTAPTRSLRFCYPWLHVNARYILLSSAWYKCDDVGWSRYRSSTCCIALCRSGFIPEVSPRIFQSQKHGWNAFSRHSREGGNPVKQNFIAACFQLDSRLRGNDKVMPQVSDWSLINIRGDTSGFIPDIFGMSGFIPEVSPRIFIQ